MATDTVTLEFRTTTKGKRLLLYSGYAYTLNKDRGKVKYWRCEDRSCSAFVHTNANDNYKAHSGTHDGHLPSPDRIELLEFKKNVEARVIHETTPIARIYEQELAAAKLSQTSLALAPDAKDAHSSLSRLRRKTIPTLPTSIEFDIPTIYTQTLDAKEFLFKDTQTRGKRELIFASEQQLVMLFESKHIFIDGTFLVCPPFFDQVLTIHGVHHAHVLPCIIALLPGRSSAFYNYLFQLLDQHASDLHMTFEPELITTDFESGLIKSVKHHFPMSRHIGCFFHYTQSIHRQIQSLGLSTLYNNDPEVRSVCQQLMALALLPRNKVESAFEHLANNHPSSINDLFNYFKDFWIEKVPIDLWNVHDLKVTTNNNAEGKM
ncbi:unnamed protein product [Rotaria sp. Silwood2]|nr:unnamed protein product [Rotaria sp. Silwood2]CAF3069028.1 unnamed protein product [Rotaria sp. Silwood2]CAF4029408.1 unnamed protein product [Rotaria sp. Silwood2]CAF4395586.1 unnamed protein product [Rotaria sp. Silwood2]